MSNTGHHGTQSPDRDGGDIAAERAQGRSRQPLKITRKKPRQRFRGVPPPLTFDLYALPDSAFLNDTEAAGSLRRAKSTLEVWRKDPDHPLRWRYVGGRVLYEVGSIRDFLKGDQPPGHEARNALSKSEEQPAARAESAPSSEADDRTPRHRARNTEARLSAPRSTASEADDRPRRRRARNAPPSQHPTATL